MKHDFESRFSGSVILAALTLALLVCFHALAGTAPPPYTGNADLATTNAIGGIGRSDSWKVASLGNSAATDVLAAASIPSVLKGSGSTNVTTAAITTSIRYVTLTRLTKSTTDVGVICGRLGPDTDTDFNCSTTSFGGCLLLERGDSCTFQIRPIASCSSYATCHIPLWVRGGTDSTGSDQDVVVGVYW